MSVQLLDKTRKIGKLLHNSNQGKVIFNDICRVLCETLSSNVLVISRKGKILGRALSRGDMDLFHAKVGEFLETDLNDRLLSVLSTKENVNLLTLGLETEEKDPAAIIAPVEMGGDRFGTLVAFRP